LARFVDTAEIECEVDITPTLTEYKQTIANAKSRKRSEPKGWVFDLEAIN